MMGAVKAVTSDQVRVKLLHGVLPLLDKLHDIGTQRDTAGNRRLHFDDYVKLVLIWMFNPLIDSISMLQRAAALPKLAQQLDIPDFSKASFSEAPAVFDPEALQQVIRELAGELRLLPADPRLNDIDKIITLADTTLLRALPKLVETFCQSQRDGSRTHGWRVHTLFDLQRGVPIVMRLTPGRKQGADGECRTLKRMLEPHRLYVCDRGYYDKSLANQMVGVGSSYVLRLKDNASYQVITSHPVTPEARAAGILSDQTVKLEGLDHPARLVCTAAEVHLKRTRRGIVDSTGQLMLLCDDLTLDAEQISLLYRYRWTIETFFAFLKQMLGCRHLLNQRKGGVQIQIYCAMIACMLLNLSTGIKPAKAVMEVIMWHLMGFADEQDVIDRIEKTRLEQEKRRLKNLAQ